MINSLFMLGSSYNKNRKISIAFIIGWIIYMFSGCDFTLGVIFPIANALVFLALSIMINLVKNEKINTVLSIFSILIWSITVDTICYFFYPMIVGNKDIITYIFQGLLFNFKYVFLNLIVICIIYVFNYLLNKIIITSKLAEKKTRITPHN